MRILLDPKPTEGGFVAPKTIAPPSITPQIAKEPPKDLPDFKLDPGVLNNDDPTRVTTEDKTGKTVALKVEQPNKENDSTVKSVEQSNDAGQKPKEESKEEAKKPSFLKPPVKETAEEKKEKIKVFGPQTKESRDYTGYDPSIVPELKQMSNSAFKFVTDLIKEKKELEKHKDSSFLQHPEAYTLSPEYRTVQSEIQFAAKEGSYWRDALIACKAGKSVRPLTGWDAKGNPILGDELQPTEQLEEAIRAAMNNGFAVAQQKQGSLSTLSQSFQERTKNDLGVINHEQAERFAWVKDPSLMDYTINIEGLGDRSIKQIKKDFVDLFPPYLQNNPGVDVASNLMVALRLQAAELAEALSGRQTAEIKKQEAQRGEPTSDVKPEKHDDIVGKVKEFSLSGMP